MEPGVLQTLTGKPLCVPGLAGATEGTGGAETDVVQQDDQNVRGSLWWQQRINGRGVSGSLVS